MSLVLQKEQARGHPEFSLLGFNLRGLLDHVRTGFPALAGKPVEVWLQSQATLACVADEGASACIHLHSVLNHPQTPAGVIAFILGHEMLHLLIPPRDVDGERKSHPPEFWETERQMFPEGGIAWAWLIVVLGGCLKRDKRRECTLVKRNWKRQMDNERPTLEWLAAFRGSRPLAPGRQAEPIL